MATYSALGVTYTVELQSLGSLSNRPTFLASGRRSLREAAPGARPRDSSKSILDSVQESPLLRTRVSDPRNLAVVQGKMPGRATNGTRAAGASAMSTRETMTLATETVIAEGLRLDDFAAAKAYGAKIVEEALDGKILFKVDSVERAFGLVDLLQKREVGSVSPNFIRRVERVAPSASVKNWSHAKIGVPAAWEITKGKPSIKVAVLDEGVDTLHSALKDAIFAERDFIGKSGNSAMPKGDDAHGTACAGIILSRSPLYPGIAPGCQLIAVRIAMGDGGDGWIFDDFATADAIDWSWRQGADVLSNSWGGGAPSDAISRAFARARTQGRGGLGSVVAIAAGNEQAPIDFPGDLPGYITVGASNPKDERKTKTSSDKETWWGSNFGATIHLLAPGVFIWTTDITGPAGYDPGNFTKTFNGTSSATPAVAGAAALMLSANPALSASSVRNILATTCKKVEKQTGWTKELGWGRLNVAKAVQAAKLAGAGSPSPTPAKSVTAKKTSKASNKPKTRK